MQKKSISRMFKRFVALAFATQVWAAVAATPMISAQGGDPLILKADGTVWFLGGNTSPVQVPNFSGGAAVAEQGGGLFVLKADGTVWAWGSQAYGELGNGVDNNSSISQPQQIAGLPSISQLNCAAGNCLAVDANGFVWAWGENNFGQIGNGGGADQPTPIMVSGLPRIVAAYAGGWWALALASDGTVWAWGKNDNGQVNGVGNSPRTVLTPQAFPNLSGVVAIAAGTRQSLALKADGTVWAWGGNTFGDLGAGPSINSSALVQVTALSGVIAISASGEQSLALKRDGTVWAWGLNSDGAIGTGNSAQTFYDVPNQVVGPNNIVQIAAAGLQGYAISSDGKVFAWGNNAFGQLGDNTLISRAIALPMAGPGGTGQFNVLEFQAETNHLPSVNASAAPVQGNAPLLVRLDGTNSFDSDGNIVSYQWISSDGHIVAGPTASLTYAQPGSYTVTLLVTDNAGGSSFQVVNVSVNAGSTGVQTQPMVGTTGDGFAGLRSDGTLFTWGFTGTSGRPAQSQIATVPGPVSYIANVVAFVSGEFDMLAINADGTVSGWGSNAGGELGDGTTTTHATPVSVQGLTNVASVAQGFIHSLALTKDGNVWAWGSNSYGQLGNGSGVSSLTPIKVPGLTGITAIAAGINYSVAMKSDGTVWAWGENDGGQLGDGTRINRPSPVQVINLSGITKIWCGSGAQTCYASTTNGTIWTWPQNQVFAAPVSTPDAVPFIVPSLKGFVFIAIAGGLGFGIDAQGQLWGWGDNSRGQLGDGTFVFRNMPTKIVGVDHALSVAAGATGGMALRSDGSVLSWGINDYGGVGDGTLAQRLTPVSVVNSTLDGLLDLLPGVPNTLPVITPPYFSQASANGPVAEATTTVTNTINFNPGDVGNSGSVFVTAKVPPGTLGVTQGVNQSSATAAATIPSSKFSTLHPDMFSPSPATRPPANKTTTTAPAANLYVLVQLTPTGWQPVVNGQLVPFATGVLGSALAAQTILNNIDTTPLIGAQFCVGYGTSAAAMAAAGTIKTIVTIPSITPVSVSCLASFTPQSGYWWNPAEGGRGYTIEQNGSSGNVFFATYLYDTSGRPTWYAAGPAPMTGSTFSAPMTAYSGGQTLTGAWQSATTGASPGNVSIIFTDATDGTLTWPGGTIPIKRYEFVSGGLNAPPTATQPQSGYWWNPAEGGRGYTVEVQNGTAFIAAYMYDANGNPVWYASGPAALTQNNTYQGSWTTYSGGETLTGSYRPAAVSGTAGSLTIQFTSATAGTLTLPTGTQIPIQRYGF